MVAVIHVLPVFTKTPPGVVVSTVSTAASGLSPFLLGPCKLYDNYQSLTMENAWQYSKVYREHSTKNGLVSTDYWTWAREGWANPRAVRYPMGKGRKPEFFLWKRNGKFVKLSYVEARKAIYGPLYAEAVKKTGAYVKLQRLYKNGGEITLLDYDGYDHTKFGMSLTDVLNEPNRKMGHAFVLAMLLTKDPALKQLELRKEQP